MTKMTFTEAKKHMTYMTKYLADKTSGQKVQVKFSSRFSRKIGLCNHVKKIITYSISWIKHNLENQDGMLILMVHETSHLTHPHHQHSFYNKMGAILGLSGHEAKEMDSQKVKTKYSIEGRYIALCPHCKNKVASWSRRPKMNGRFCAICAHVPIHERMIDVMCPDGELIFGAIEHYKQKTDNLEKEIQRLEQNLRDMKTDETYRKRYESTAKEDLENANANLDRTMTQLEEAQRRDGCELREAYEETIACAKAS